MSNIIAEYQGLIIRLWCVSDRQIVANLIASVLAEYGLNWEPLGADQDVINIEEYYLKIGGEFWVVEAPNGIVGTCAYYPIDRGKNAVEIRKMYFLPSIRGLGLGKFLLHRLEERIKERGFWQIWIETTTVLERAVNLYENNGYLPTTGVETSRCDRVYLKYLTKDSSD